jgi:carboxyl-terminal processing protease
MHAGDRIVKVDSVEISGPELTNARVAELLKGPSGTHVRVGVSRKGRVLQYDLVRDRIPIHSVVAALELEPGIGYIKVVRFAANTAEEFEAGMGKLAAAGVRSVVVDLRGNGGGYLNAVVPMVAGFLEKGDKVVYTEGRHVPRTDYEAEEPGKWRDWNVAVLIDEGSASASEIFAGAIQDNDRGAVIGRRSFGKGLVQEEFGLSDAGALRLTVARFYTPTGRAIQRPYSDGTDAYSEEPGERMENGELFHGAADEGPDSLRYETPEGRVVYGGGGIAPDFFVPLDTAGLTDRVAEWMWLGEVRDASFAFVDARRKALEPIRPWRHSMPPSVMQRLRISYATARANSGWCLMRQSAGCSATSWSPKSPATSSAKRPCTKRNCGAMRPWPAPSRCCGIPQVWPSGQDG